MNRFTWRNRSAHTSARHGSTRKHQEASGRTPWQERKNILAVALLLAECIKRLQDNYPKVQILSIIDWHWPRGALASRPGGAPALAARPGGAPALAARQSSHARARAAGSRSRRSRRGRRRGTLNEATSRVGTCLPHLRGRRPSSRPAHGGWSGGEQGAALASARPHIDAPPPDPPAPPSEIGRASCRERVSPYV